MYNILKKEDDLKSIFVYPKIIIYNIHNYQNCYFSDQNIIEQKKIDIPFVVIISSLLFTKLNRNNNNSYIRYVQCSVGLVCSRSI